MAQELSTKAKGARAEYYRRWRAANPDKVREKNRRYWERRALREEQEEAEKNDSTA